MAARQDPLWVPLLTHFRAGGGGVVVDPVRMAAQIRAMQPEVRQYLLGGSTGDGWELDEHQFGDLISLSRTEVFTGTRVLMGVLRPTTGEVIARARMVERALVHDGPPRGVYAGLTVCPPVAPEASQGSILAHYRAVLEATESPIAVYQLPQITGCSLEPATVRTLARDPRIIMFKDTSGTDTVASAGPIPGVAMVRGAEGGYLAALAPSGPYDGWLLSSANVFGRVLRRILDLHAADEGARASRLSGILAMVVEALFDAAAEIAFGNPFSNANRAADHVLATGRTWRDVPAPLSASGNALPARLLEAAADILEALRAVSDAGYLPVRKISPRAKLRPIEEGAQPRVHHRR
ncbi:MAG: dihydrodipicolinate synthase family protein [Acetobacteraceae bacterium]